MPRTRFGFERQRLGCGCLACFAGPAGWPIIRSRHVQETRMHPRVGPADANAPATGTNRRICVMLKARPNPPLGRGVGVGATELPAGGACAPSWVPRSSARYASASCTGTSATGRPDGSPWTPPPSDVGPPGGHEMARGRTAPLGAPRPVSVERLPPAVVQLRIDDPHVLACLGNLPSGDEAVLDLKQFLARAEQADSHDWNSCDADAHLRPFWAGLWTRHVREGRPVDGSPDCR
jgi:hypothetical protein